MVYVVNSPVLTAYGDWRLEPLPLEQARALVAGEFTSAVGHKETAQVLTQLLGVAIPEQRISIQMQPGDTALVLRMKQRLAASAALDKHALQQSPYELALLRRLA